MASLIDRLRGRDSKTGDVSTVLNELVAGKVEAPVEIEGNLGRFRSRVRLRSGSVLLGYPQSLHNLLEPGSWIRLLLPEDYSQALLLQIASGQYNGAFSQASGKDVMMLMCRLHGAAIIPNARRHMRYNTTRFKDVAFHTTEPAQTFKIVNVSRSGLQIATDPDRLGQYPIGSHLPKSIISLGGRTRVDITESRIRSHHATGIGMEMIVSSEGTSSKVLEVFLNWIQGEEMKLAGQAI